MLSSPKGLGFPPVDPFDKAERQHHHFPLRQSSQSDSQPCYPTFLWDAAIRGMTSTHSFGFGLVGIGGPSFPGDGDSLPWLGGESRTMWAWLEGVTWMSAAAGSDSGRGGGGGGSGASLGKLGGDGGCWPFCRGSCPLSLSPSSTSELIWTRGGTDALGHNSSSLTRNASKPGWGSALGGNSRRLISVGGGEGGGGGGGKEAASSNPELSPDMPLLDESSAAGGSK